MPRKQLVVLRRPSYRPLFPDVALGEFNAETTAKESVPADLMAWIEGNPGVEVLEGPSDVTIGGHPAKQILVAGAASGVALFDMGATQFVLFPGEVARLIVLDVNGELVVIAAGAFGDERGYDDANFEAVVPHIEAMLATVRFE